MVNTSANEMSTYDWSFIIILFISNPIERKCKNVSFPSFRLEEKWGVDEEEKWKCLFFSSMDFVLMCNIYQWQMCFETCLHRGNIGTIHLLVALHRYRLRTLLIALLISLDMHLCIFRLGFWSHTAELSGYSWL